MRRKTFDLIAAAGGAALTMILLAAGALGLWGYNYASTNVHNQLATQQVYFPTAAQFAHPDGTEVTTGMIPYLAKYAGQEVLTGSQAEAYADHFIAVHLSQMPYGGVYSAVSTASRANPNNAALKAEVTTAFQGTTLRGLLLEAYGFSTFGQIALVASVISFILAGLMFLLTAVGVWHFRRTPVEQEFPQSVAHHGLVPAGV